MPTNTPSGPACHRRRRQRRRESIGLCRTGHPTFAGLLVILGPSRRAAPLRFLPLLSVLNRVEKALGTENLPRLRTRCYCLLPRSRTGSTALRLCCCFSELLVAIKPSSNAQTFGLQLHCISALNVASDKDNFPKYGASALISHEKSGSFISAADGVNPGMAKLVPYSPSSSQVPMA